MKVQRLVDDDMKPIMGYTLVINMEDEQTVAHFGHAKPDIKECEIIIKWWELQQHRPFQVPAYCLNPN